MRKNDRKAPRMRKGKYSKSVITKELWKDFRKEFPEYAKMTDKELNTAWRDIATMIRQEAITNPLGVKLGSYTGEIKLQYLPIKFDAYNHAASEEVGEKRKHMNLVTRGKVARIKWERRWAVKFNKMLQFLAFVPTREMCSLAKKHTDAFPEKLRVSRNTLGGKSIWRQLK